MLKLQVLLKLEGRHELQLCFLWLIPEVPGNASQHQFPQDKEELNDNAAEDSSAPSHQLNGQDKTSLENAHLRQ